MSKDNADMPAFPCIEAVGEYSGVTKLELATILILAGAKIEPHDQYSAMLKLAKVARMAAEVLFSEMDVP